MLQTAATLGYQFNRETLTNYHPKAQTGFQAPHLHSLPIREDRCPSFTGRAGSHRGLEEQTPCLFSGLDCWGCCGPLQLNHGLWSVYSSLSNKDALPDSRTNFKSVWPSYSCLLHWQDPTPTQVVLPGGWICRHIVQPPQARRSQRSCHLGSILPSTQSPLGKSRAQVPDCSYQAEQGCRWPDLHGCILINHSVLTVF